MQMKIAEHHILYSCKTRKSCTLIMQNQKIMYFNHAKPENHVL